MVLGLHQHRSEQASKAPLIPPTVLRLRAMRIGLLLAVAFFTTFGGFMFVFALATQGEARHVSAGRRSEPAADGGRVPDHSISARACRSGTAPA